jgi:hypothetical protein
MSAAFIPAILPSVAIGNQPLTAEGSGGSLGKLGGQQDWIFWERMMILDVP